MPKMKSLDSDGKALFVSIDGKKYEKEIPQDLLEFILLWSSYAIWHWGETESFSEKYSVQFMADNHLNDWGDLNVSLDWGNNGIVNLKIIGYFDYTFKTIPSLTELVTLMQNQKQMKEYIQKNAILSKVQRK